MKWLVALFAIVMALGAATSAMADSHNIAPISISTDAKSYEDGDIMKISGTIKNLDPNFACGVTVQVWGPANNLIRIAQTAPTTDGIYEISFKVGGPQWKDSGDYTVTVRCNADDMSTTISYTAAPLVCGEGFENVDGVCVELPPPPVVCGEGTELVDGVCVELPPPPVVCGEGTELVDGVCQVVRPPPPPPALEPLVCGEGFEEVDGVCVELPPPVPVCGEGTELVDGVCQAVTPPPAQGNGGGCLIATAAYGTEMASQVQYLREIRDGTLMSTSSGTSFMAAFNQMYYSVSPQIADMERESPAFREVVRVAITPLLASLSLMSLAEDGSEASVVGVGTLIIALNAGMYVGLPALLAFKAYGRVRAMQSN